MPRMKGVATRRRKCNLKGFYHPDGWANLKRPRGYRLKRGCEAPKVHHTDPPCPHPHHARGYCKKHYNQLLRCAASKSGLKRTWKRKRKPGERAHIHLRHGLGGAYHATFAARRSVELAVSPWQMLTRGIEAAIATRRERTSRTPGKNPG